MRVGEPFSVALSEELPDRQLHGECSKADNNTVGSVGGGCFLCTLDGEDKQRRMHR